jgi:hypothetical protein
MFMVMEVQHSWRALASLFRATDRQAASPPWRAVCNGSPVAADLRHLRVLHRDK